MYFIIFSPKQGQGVKPSAAHLYPQGKGNGGGGQVQGPVVRTPVSTNPGFNFIPGFFFFLLKALYRIILSIFLRVSNHQIEGNVN